MAPHYTLTAGQAASLVDGELLGADETLIAGVASLDTADSGDLTFLASPRYLKEYQGCRAAVVLVDPAFRDEPTEATARILVPRPLAALAKLIPALLPEPEPAWRVAASALVGRGTHWTGRIAIGANATIGDRVKFGEACVVAPGAVIEDEVVMGNNCRIGPHAVVHQGAQLGDRVILRAGARVAGPGFAFYPGSEGPERVPHVGTCVIEDDVEIGANTTIDRGSVTATVVGKGTKVDNLVQIAHNVRIGERCIIMAQVGVAGSAVVGRDVLIAGQAGLADHVVVGPGARIAAQAGVIGEIEAGATVSGYPARNHRTVLRQAAALSRLAPVARELERLARRESNG